MQLFSRRQCLQSEAGFLSINGSQHKHEDWSSDLHLRITYKKENTKVDVWGCGPGAVCMWI